MIDATKQIIKSRLSGSQVAALRIFLARLGRRTATSLEELWLDRLAKAGHIKTFIQIGANDGDEADPVAAIINRHSLTGIMIEPQPHYFKILERRHRDRKGIVTLNVAVSAKEEQRVMFHLPHDHAGLPPWAHGLGSFHRDVVVGHRTLIPDIERIVQETPVTCTTLKKILQDNRVAGIDLFITDTEGHDHAILQQLDLPTLRPKVVIYESKHLSASERRACAVMLGGGGYVLVPSNDNIIAFRKDIAGLCRISSPETMA